MKFKNNAFFSALDDYQDGFGDRIISIKLNIKNPTKKDLDFIYKYDGDNVIATLEKPILDKVERYYLSSVIKPFKDNIKGIIKDQSLDFKDDEYITLLFKEKDNFMPFPYFKKGTMYKGMENDKLYTLEELGL